MIEIELASLDRGRRRAAEAEQTVDGKKMETWKIGVTVVEVHVDA